jgi:glycosyltransferase involved in cell wall biosynthesis
MTRTLLHVFSTFNPGGPQIRFVGLANYFGARYRHRIVAMDGATEALSRLDPGLDAKLLPIDVHPGRTLRNVKAFRRHLTKMRPDLLVTSNWGSIEWAIANLGQVTPHLHMEDGFGPEEADRQLPRRVWTRRLVLRHSAVLFPSRTLFTIARDIWQLRPQRLLHVPNGIDCARFDIPGDDALATKYGLARDQPLIGAVGGIRAEKNLFRLLDAFGLVLQSRPARLVIVGDGPQREELRAAAAARDLSDRVVFTGACPTPERLLPFFAVSALSSDTEQMPLSILEAMAAARPVASTNVGDVQEMLAEENRPFVVPRDAARLAEAILALLAEPGKRENIGRANRARAASVYDQRRMFASYGRLFDGELTAGNPPLAR